MLYLCPVVFFFQAEDGIRYLVRSRGLGDVYKRQQNTSTISCNYPEPSDTYPAGILWLCSIHLIPGNSCLLYTSDAADERSSVDLGGRRIIKKKKNVEMEQDNVDYYNSEMTSEHRLTEEIT